MEEELQGEPILGGHEFEFVDYLSPGQSCPICLLAIRKPVQTVCGHRFCESCLLETFRGDHDPPICPEDRNPLPEDGGVFRDMAWERDILSLRVKCKRSDRGCEWTGVLRYYKEHFVFCEHEDVTCDNCKGEIQRRLLHEHTTSQCPNRIVQCKYCGEEFALCHIQCHEDIECTRFPVGCPQECGEEEIPREEVESHVRNDCVKAMVYCPFHEAGCTFYDERRNLEAHLEASVKEHLSKTWSKLSKTTERLNELEELELDKEYMQRLLHSNNEELSELRLSEKKLQLENDRLKNDVKRLQDDMVVLRRLYMENKDEIDSLKRLVQTTEEKRPEKPLKLKTKKYKGKNTGDSRSAASKFFAAAVGLRTGAGTNCRKNENRNGLVDLDSDDEYEWPEVSDHEWSS